MKNIDYIYDESELRQKAENIFREKASKGEEASESDKLTLIHELEVHQIELELQNHELEQTRMEAIQAANKYSRLYDNAPSGFFTLSRDGKILEVNLAGSKMLGKNPDELKYKKLVFFISVETRSLFTGFVQQVFESKEKESCEVKLTSDGNKSTYLYLTGISTEIGDECLITAVDITEHKQAIVSLIEHQRLGAIGEMANSIAHDFNNALQSIMGNLDMALNDSGLSTKTQSHLKIIKTLVTDAAARVHHLQRFTGRKTDINEYTMVNLNVLIEEVVNQSQTLWKNEAEQKGLTIHVNTIFENIPAICGNKGELRTALYNIIKNSIEALPRGGDISFKTAIVPDGISLSVTDTGTGMNEETKTRIFQPFYSTKGTDPGRGLGMSGVHNIIKEHGATISIKNSAPGKGTTIEMIFPVFKKSQTEDTVKEQPKEKDGIVNVLWVEDDDSISTVASEMIKFLGHKCDSVNSGKEALKLLEKNNYNVVITDIGMPEMNGWQLAEIIDEKFGGQMKVAVVSGWGSQIKEEEKRKYGVDFVLSKPFNMAQLQDLIEKVHAYEISE